MTSPSNWFSESNAEKAARALDPEAWATLDSDSIGMMTRRKVSIEQARAALRAVNPFEWMPKIKWDSDPDGSWWYSVDGDLHDRSLYVVYPNRVGSDWCLKVCGHLLEDEFNSADDAKAAAQSDYEFRFRAALPPSPQEGNK